MLILVTGGVGYIGSHIVKILDERGHQVVILDNFSNSDKRVFKRLREICNKEIILFDGDIRNYELLDKIFQQTKIDCVIHLAGLKAVGESCNEPIKYYDNNVLGTLNLLKAMKNHDVKKLVFSSSATVYGIPESLPLTENHVLQATNPYGQTKLHIENMLSDIYKSDNAWSIVCLRYFNPIGAISCGSLGDDPSGIPNNLMPYLVKVAAKELPYLEIFGNDYDTVDGSGVRDYIHVEDLAMGHVSAIDYIKDQNEGVHDVFNLGTGQGTSVFQLIDTFEGVTGTEVPIKVTQRRSGDVETCYADPSRAQNKLDWIAKKNLNEMCISSWNFYLENISNS